MSTATAATISITPEFAGTFRDIMLDALQHESTATKRVIGNIPEDKKDYRPHPKSRSAWELATHLATSDMWFLNGVADQNFAWTGEPPVPAQTVADLLNWYEENHKKALARVRAMKPNDLAKNVEFFGIMNHPAAIYLRMALEHTIHHRGQLSTYLRPMGAKVPDIMGGSADEPFQG